MAPRDTLSRDSLEYERRGRLLRDDHYREVMRARARQLLRVAALRCQSGDLGREVGNQPPVDQ